MKDGEVNIEWGNDKRNERLSVVEKYREKIGGGEKENNAEGNLVVNEFEYKS